MRENYKKLSLRLTASEYAHLQKQAGMAGLKMEPFLRQLVMGVELHPRPPDTYAALLRELSAIGNNVNQIAYWANSRRGISQDDMQEAVVLIRRAWRLVKEAF